MSYTNRFVLANLWLLEPLVKRQFGRTPVGNAILRTTTAVTIIEGGVKENVLPLKARAIINFRILPGDRIESVIQHIRQTIADPRVKIARFGAQNTEPSSESDVNASSFAILQRTISQIFPNTLVAPNLLVAGTDTKHFEKLSSNIYRFQPIKAGPQDLSRPHGINERIGVEDYKEVVRFYIQLIRNATL
jgi:carboxypeptidase PM20D1